jgi:hypothetical protein
MIAESELPIHITWQLNISNVIPDLIRHPVRFWIPTFAGMTALTYLMAFTGEYGKYIYCFF